MSKNRISVAEVEAWNAESVRAVFAAAHDRGDAAAQVSASLGALEVFDTWGGAAAAAAASSLATTRRDLDAHGREALAVAQAAKTAADGIEALQARLAGLTAEAARNALTINPHASAVALTDTAADDPGDALIVALDLQHRLDAILDEADDVDDALAAAIDMADGDAPIPATPGPPERAGVWLQHQLDAFAGVFRRRPTSAADWATAAELDPHSYDGRYGGAEANIVAGKIAPMPGRGVVRASLFIPSASVKDPALGKWPPLDDNAGDDRGFDPAAAPQRARIAIEIDYENGLVVARQNPSVNLTTGKVKTGTPTVKAAQRRDGSVYLDYAAADPFSPGGEAVARQTLCVRGQLVVDPGSPVPRIGGTVTAFPAFEAYHDRPVGPGAPPTTTAIARMWPANTGEWGPELGLPVTRGVGDTTVLSQFTGVAGGVPALPVATTRLGAADHAASVAMLK